MVFIQNLSSHSLKIHFYADGHYCYPLVKKTLKREEFEKLPHFFMQINKYEVLVLPCGTSLIHFNNGDRIKELKVSYPETSDQNLFNFFVNFYYANFKELNFNKKKKLVDPFNNNLFIRYVQNLKDKNFNEAKLRYNKLQCKLGRKSKLMIEI